jgi:hypothetical protein
VIDKRGGESWVVRVQNNGRRRDMGWCNAQMSTEGLIRLAFVALDIAACIRKNIQNRSVSSITLSTLAC